MSDKRFVRLTGEGNGFVGRNEIWVDTQTGVNYFFHADGYAGGLTVLVDANGKPVISPAGYANREFPTYE